MATDTLHDYEALLESGFSEQQARAVVRLITPPRTDPEVLHRLDQIAQQLDTHSRVLEAILPLVQAIPSMAHDIGEMKQGMRDLSQDVSSMKVEQGETRAELYVIEERVKLEGRVSRMINATLIALGAIAASLVAAFAR